MATKTVKTKIKVEEIAEEKPKVEEVKKEAPMKISSFSQLDTQKSAESLQEDAPSVIEEKVPESIPEIKPDEKVESAASDVSNEGNQEKMSSDDVKQWLKDIRPDTTKEVEKSSSFNFKMFFVFLLIFAVIGALIGGLFYYKQKVGGTATIGSETPTPTEETTPEPTEPPKVVVDLSKLSVNILNGSGIKGEAGKVKSLLEKAGFTSEKIDTGNASSYDYKSTSVSLKKSVPEEVFEKVKAALGTGYEVVKGVGTVKDSSSYDVEIIVGKKG